jgi:hypothetical protein
MSACVKIMMKESASFTDQGQQACTILKCRYQIRPSFSSSCILAYLSCSEGNTGHTPW